MSSLRLLGAAGVLALVFASPAAAHKRGHHHKQEDVKVQLLAFNDFHGHLQTTTTGGISIDPPPPQTTPPSPTTRPAGGAAIVGRYVRELERQNRNSLLVTAGDLIGGSPLLSGLFHDEPTIEAMNLIGLDLASVGNHEFDEGADELKRMQRGGCHPDDGCQDGTPFRGADFRYLAANVIRRDNAKPFFPPYSIRRFQGKKVGFIGMTLEGTPSIVSPSGIANLQFLDEAATANRYARELRRRHGVKAIVVLLHEGGFPAVPFNTTTVDDRCTGGISGPVLDIVENTTADVDAFITGHTHQAYNCVIDGRRVTSASSFGRALSDVDLTIGRNGDVKSVDARTIATYAAGQQPVADVQRVIDRYDELSADARREPVGRISADIRDSRNGDTPDASGEFPAGNLIADAQLADTKAADRGGAVVALMNPGGVRSDFLFADSGTEGDEDGLVTYEEAFTVQPFNNLVTTQTFTGTQLLEVLKDQWCGSNTRATILLPSKGFHYTWDESVAASTLGQPCAGAENPVTISDVTINGVAVTETGTYRITTNNFLADGGDDFLSLTQGTNRTTLPEGEFDIDSLVDYMAPTLAGAPPINPPALDRIDTKE